MIFFCSTLPNDSLLDNLGNISQILIALMNLFLAFYVFVYQKRKDKKDDLKSSQINESTVKLQWFKELVFEPNKENINSYFLNISLIKSKITSNDLSEKKKIEINDCVKTESAKFRKQFIDILLIIDKSFGEEMQSNIDNLVDDITNAIFNEDLRLKNDSTYEKHIGSKIVRCKNDLLALLYNYQG